MEDSSPPGRGLGRSQRLKHRRDFARGRTEGHRVVQGCLILNWVVLPNGAVSRLGVITARRLGNAVVRSRARRLLRETFRLHRHELTQAVDVILVARSSILRKGLNDVTADFLAALKRARLRRVESSEQRDLN